MKICLFTETYVPIPDGVARQVYLLKKELCALGHEVEVFTYALNKKWYKFEDNTHRFFSVKFPWYPQYRIGRIPIPFISRAVKDADIIHLHTPFFMGTSGFIAAKRHNIPSISTLHTYFIEMKESLDTIVANRVFLRWAWIYNLGVYRRCDIVTTPSKRISKILIKSGFPKDVYIVPNGIDVKAYRENAGKYNIRKEFDIPQDVPILTYLGRLTRDKGVHYLLRTIRMLKDKGIEAFGLICGVGLEMENLRKMALNLGINNQVLFTGYVPEDMKPSIMAQSFLFFLLSKADVQPLSIIEAMSCGTPTLGYDKGGLPELIVDGKVGYILPYDDVGAVVERVKFLIENEDVYKSMREQCIRYTFEKWSVTRTAERYLELYEKAHELRTIWKGRG